MTRGIEARRIAFSLAGEQAGILARRQLRARCLSDGLINHWIKTGYLIKFLPGIYSLGRPAESREAFWTAGVLFAGERSVLAGVSAAHALGMTKTSDLIEVARPSGCRRSVRGCPPHDRRSFILRRARVEQGDLVFVSGLPVMNAARVLIDLAGLVTEPALRRFFIEAGCANLLTPECLDQIEDRSRGFNGRSELLALKRRWDPSGGKVRSVLEGEFRLLCAEHGLPAPLMNQRLDRYEVDAMWAKGRLVVELDGRRFHRGGLALESDTAKTRELRSIGYRVLRFTWNDIVSRPEWVAHLIRQHLSSSCSGIAAASGTQV